MAKVIPYDSGGLPDLRKVARLCMPLLALWKRRAPFQILTALISSLRSDFFLLVLNLAASSHHVMLAYD
jgi:hypothetical protein